MEIREISKKILALLLLPSALHCMEVAQVYVDTSGNLYPEECSYVSAREQNVTRQAIAELINPDGSIQISADTKFPRIAFLGSGGGLRATTDYDAMLAGFLKSGVYRCATYASGLSGGGWTLFTLILRGLDPISYGSILKQRLCQNDPQDKLKNIISKLVQVSRAKGEIDFVDTWGAIVSEKLFGDISNQDSITFQNIRNNLNPKLYPYPVCQVVLAQTNSNYDCLEINPFEIYSGCLGGAIPNFALGSVFNDGRLISSKPPLPFEFYMGMIGSAFALSLGDLVDNGIKELADALNVDKIGEELTDHIDKINSDLGFYREHFFPAQVPNYSFGMPASKLKNLPNFTTTDGGVAINLPFQSLLRQGVEGEVLRAIDIYIACDSSSEAHDREFTELRYAADWAHFNKIPFPSLAKFKIARSNQGVPLPDMIIFYEDDPTIPYVIYLSNQIAVGTTSLTYTEEQFDSLFGFMQDLAFNGSPAIVESIKNKMGLPNTFDSLPQGHTSWHFPCCVIS